MLTGSFVRVLRRGHRRAAVVLAIGLASAPAWLPADDLLLLRRDGLLPGFTSQGDLRPAAAFDPTVAAVRSTVPAPRAVPVESFAHLKSAVPLLVGDIDVPRRVAVVRPMVGRPVGAVPER